jgi:hypothetical protein
VTASPLLCDRCGTSLLVDGSHAIAVGRCAICVKTVVITERFGAQPTWATGSMRCDDKHPYVINNGNANEPRCCNVPTTGGTLIVNVTDEGIGPDASADVSLWTDAVRVAFTRWLAQYDEAGARLEAMEQLGYEPIENGIEPSAARVGGGR